MLTPLDSETTTTKHRLLPVQVCDQVILEPLSLFHPSVVASTSIAILYR